MKQWNLVPVWILYLDVWLLTDRSDFDIDLHPGRKFQLFQFINRFSGRVNDVHKPLVGAHLELLPRFLINVGRLEHGEFFLPGGQWYRTDHLGTGTAGGLDDLRRGLVEDTVVISP